MSGGPDHGALPTSSGRETWRTVRGALRPDRVRACVAAAVLVGATAVGLLTAPLLGAIVDTVVAGGPREAVVLAALAIGGVVLVQGAAIAVGETQLVKAGEGALARLREAFVATALRLPMARLEAAGSGDLTARASHDIAAVRDVVRQSLPAFLRAVLTIVLTLVGLLVLDWRFALAALLGVPIQLLAARSFVRRAVPLYARQRVATGALQQQLLDTVGGAHTVTAHGLEDRHADLVERRSREAIDLTVRGIVVVNRFFGRLNVAEFVGLAAVLATGFLLVRAGAASIGDAAAAALYFHALFGPINVALGLLDEAQTAAAALARLTGVVALPTAQADAQPSEKGTTGPPRITATALGHAYLPGHPVLDDVDLDIAPGGLVAVVGTSGAGKTTLGRLVAGVQAPTTGTVLVDAAPPRTGDSVALLTQEVHVFAGPLGDDLRLAKPDATDAEIDAALEAVGAADWVHTLPDGPATVVGEGGHPLTAAQAQQLALARLMLAEPRAAVLDEATAEAGSAAAAVLHKAIAAALAGRTGLVIAHRLDQAATADLVLVLERGRVLESGSHQDLLARGGRYAELWTAWSATAG